MTGRSSVEHLQATKRIMTLPSGSVLTVAGEPHEITAIIESVRAWPTIVKERKRVRAISLARVEAVKTRELLAKKRRLLHRAYIVVMKDPESKQIKKTLVAALTGKEPITDKLLEAARYLVAKSPATIDLLPVPKGRTG